MTDGIITKTSRLRVLIIDDDAADTYALEKHLNAVDDIKMEIWAGQCGGSAREIISSRRFDLCFIDFWLGSVTSIELIKTVLDQTDAKVVLITGMGSDDVRKMGISAGAVDYMSKDDINAASIRKMIDRLFC